MQVFGAVIEGFYTACILALALYGAQALWLTILYFRSKRQTRSSSSDDDHSTTGHCPTPNL